MQQFHYLQSQLYKDAVEKGFDLPEDYAGYSFHLILPNHYQQIV